MYRSSDLCVVRVWVGSGCGWGRGADFANYYFPSLEREPVGENKKPTFLYKRDSTLPREVTARACSWLVGSARAPTRGHLPMLAPDRRMQSATREGNPGTNLEPPPDLLRIYRPARRSLSRAQSPSACPENPPTNGAGLALSPWNCAGLAPSHPQGGGKALKEDSNSLNDNGNSGGNSLAIQGNSDPFGAIRASTKAPNARTAAIHSPPSEPL